MQELRSSEQTSYQAILLSLINCLIMSNDSLEDRTEMRSEFIGLNIQAILDDLRRLDDHELQVHIELFLVNRFIKRIEWIVVYSKYENNKLSVC